MKIPKLVEVIDLPQRRCINLNAIRYNLLHLMFLLGQRGMNDKANEVAHMNMKLIDDSLIGRPEEFYTC